jgi:hypothetical protein
MIYGCEEGDRSLLRTIEACPKNERRKPGMKRVLLAAFVIAVLLMGLVGTAVAASPADSPGKGLTDKVVFVQYAKDAPAKHEPGKPGGTLTGVLNPDYKYSGIHWADPTGVEYWLNPTGSDVSSGSTIAAIKAAMATWANASGPLGYDYQGTTTREAGVADGYNVVSWADISDKYPNAIAVTTIWYYRNHHIAEVDTVMNSDLPWSYTDPGSLPDLSGAAQPVASRYTEPSGSGDPNAYDIQDIMTHEAGHWIMLGDLYNSKDSSLTMYGYGSKGEISKDTLAYGDERGVEAVYGA